jgi:hypothetical protein
MRCSSQDIRFAKELNRQFRSHAKGETAIVHIPLFWLKQPLASLYRSHPNQPAFAISNTRRSSNAELEYDTPQPPILGGIDN